VAEAVEWVRRCTCESEIEIRLVSELAEHAVRRPEHEDYLHAQIAHR
jgi:hypothetical protein